jgi:hypothetical protein
MCLAIAKPQYAAVITSVIKYRIKAARIFINMRDDETAHTEAEGSPV